MAKNKHPAHTPERAEWLRSLAGGSWLWVAPLVGKRYPARVASRAGILWIGQRQLSAGNLQPNTDTRAVAWVEPMTADQVATHEHAEQTALALQAFELAFFGPYEGRENRRARLTPEDVATLRAIAAKAGR